MNEALRQTGRTTRLIEKAVQLAHHGRAVYILIAPGDSEKRWEKQINDLWQRLYPGRGGHGIKLETERDLGFNWETMRVGAAHSNCVFLVDHYLVEQKIEYLHKELAQRAELIKMLYPLTV